MKLLAAKLRGILRNSPKPLPSFAKATEGSLRLHPRSKLRGIRRRRIKRSGFSSTPMLAALLRAAKVVEENPLAITDIPRPLPHQR